MSWPNQSSWSAERNEKLVETSAGNFFTWVVQCGSLHLPSGRLVACDPFVFLQPSNNPYLQVPPGRYPVTVTLADVSSKLDRSHIREAYATVGIAEGNDAYRRVLPLLRDGETLPILKDDEIFGFPVDAGTACFVDDWAAANCMPSVDTWAEQLFDNDRDDSWFKRMDDPHHIRKGLANIVLPLARNGENIIIFHSGWGDGFYPVVGSFDNNDRLTALHIDFGVIP